MTVIHPLPTADLWLVIRREAEARLDREPSLAHLFDAFVLDRESFTDALIYMLAEELSGHYMTAPALREIFDESLGEARGIIPAAQRDLNAVLERDPAAASPLPAFLFFKGYQALQGYRFAHYLWNSGRTMLAFSLQSRIAKRFAVDIHPAARLGAGIMMDHATGIVIGETAVIEDDVSILHDVTLGGTGNETGDRHPKIRSGVMIGAGAKILGNIEIGAGARIAAGSVVLENVPPRVTVAGVPARVVGNAGGLNPAEDMEQTLPEHDDPPEIFDFAAAAGKTIGKI